MAHDTDPLKANNLTPEQILAQADAEAGLFSESYDQLANQKLVRGTSLAVDRLVYLIAHGNESTQLRAATYLLDRVFGKPTTAMTPLVESKMAKSPLDLMLEKMLEGAE